MIAGARRAARAKARRAVKIVYDRDEDIAATTKRHPARTRHRTRRSTRDGELLAMDVDVRDGRRRVPDAVAGRAVARRAARGRAVPLPERARARPRRRDEHVRRTARSAGSARRRRRSPSSARWRSSRARSARIRWRCASALALRSGDTTATGQVLGVLASAPTRCSSASRAASRDAAPARDGGDTARRCGAAAASAFFFHGAGFTGSGEQRLAGRGDASRCIADGRVRGALELDRHRPGRDHDLHADRRGRARRRSDACVDVVDPTTARCPTAGRPSRAARAWSSVGSSIERGAARSSRLGASTARAAARDAAAACAAHGEPRPCSTSRRPASQWDDATYTGAAYPVYGWAACLVDVAVDLDTYEVDDRSLRAGGRRRQGDQPGHRRRARSRAARCRRSAGRVLENVVYKDGQVANANMTNCIVPDVRGRAELETIARRGAVSVRAERREGRRRDSDGRARPPRSRTPSRMRSACAFDALPISPEAVAASRARRS